MSNELTNKHAPLPAHLEKYRMVEPDDEEFGLMEPADIGLNMLKLGQSNSREVKKTGWGFTGQEPQIPVGAMFLSKDGKIIPAGTGFIPLVRTVKFIHWIGPKGQGRINFMCDKPDDPRIVKMNGLAFIDDPHDNSRKPPLVTKYVNFYIMLQGCELPVLLSFKRTSIPDGKWLTNSTRMATISNQVPMFGLTYLLGQPKTVVDGSNDWYALTFQPAGLTPPPAIEKAAKMAQFAKDLAKLASAKDYEAMEHTDEGGEAAAAAGARAVEGTTIDAQATVVAPNGNVPPAPVVIIPPQQPVQQAAPVQQQPVQQAAPVQQQPVQQAAPVQQQPQQPQQPPAPVGTKGIW